MGNSRHKSSQSSSFWHWLGMVVFCLAALVFAVFALIQGLQYHRAIEQIEDNRDITIYSGSYELDVIQSSRRRRYVHYLFTLDNGDRLWVWKHNMANPEEIAAADEAGNPLPLTFRYGNLLIENDLISYQPFSIADTQGGQVFLSQESAAVSFRRDRAVAYFLSGLFLLCDLTFG